MLVLMLFFFSTTIDSDRGIASPSLRPAEKKEKVGLNEVSRRRAPPELSAESYVVRIIGEETPLLSRRSDKPLPPASLTKLMTAAIAFEGLAPDQPILLSRDAKNVEEKTSGAAAGEVFSRDGAIKMALISSANDAALALADETGRKRGAYDFSSALARFVETMNQYARAQGLRATNFVNPTGLDMEGHHASADDIARLMEYLWNRHPRLLEFSRTIETSVLSRQGYNHKVSNTNDLLKEFPAILGSKTGFTDAAQGALALWYPASDRRVALVVLLGSPDRFKDGKRVLRWLEDVF